MKTVNGIKIPDGEYHRMRQQRRQGMKVFIEIPEPLSQLMTLKNRNATCSNCSGGGAIAVSWYVGGPFDYVPPCSPPPDPANVKDLPTNAMYINDRWYQVKRRGFNCPVCRGAV